MYLKMLCVKCPPLHIYERMIEYCLPSFNTLRPRQNGRHFTDDILECIFLYENISILMKKISEVYS